MQEAGSTDGLITWVMPEGPVKPLDSLEAGDSRKAKEPEEIDYAQDIITFPLLSIQFPF